jgi:phenylalanine-4-hydroxylase
MPRLKRYATDLPPVRAPDWVIDQAWEEYTEVEHQTWLTLYQRQMAILPARACDTFLRGLTALDLRGQGVPDFDAINEKLQALTGWTVVPVPGLVPDEVFFDHLANRRFPAARFIRRPDQLDYLEEPDVFHDVFGHVPMLCDPAFADYMAAYGKAAQAASGPAELARLSRLYWYTVEFGLLETPEGLRIYGAGILSSGAESVFSLDDPSPNRLGFDSARVMRTPYRIDDLQQVYFVVPDLKTLIRGVDLRPEPQGVDPETGELPIDVVLETDVVLSKGSQRYALNRAA